MMSIFIPEERAMARRTIYLPQTVDELVRASAEEGESYSAVVARLIEAGVRLTKGGRTVSYAASGDGPDDLGRLAESYLHDLVRAR
jgi:hypothetical protein